jgi:hypothetical protein
MRLGAVLSALVLLTACLAYAQHPVPPGMRDGEQRINNQQTDPPAPPVQPRVDTAKIRSEASELRDLADGLPTAVDQVAKGAMPKDLAENLKKIEKLAKHLRSEVNP